MDEQTNGWQPEPDGNSVYWVFTGRPYDPGTSGLLSLDAQAEPKTYTLEEILAELERG